ncbi:hypothetical protein IU433_05965 [Nocardia puris]|uniref:hypothetical protein n=1 Tax=Nocardia puris TaxID=208602 RepID=UPI000830FA45|nr:hypothetical protein [Nocardia puris]MBF6209503.1 hypothetical protein [Nocardia puris]MBF6366075.1 hypothetical protein [Nocardia puris]MBF6458584.1 hypothetical protein [Nocardia puris]
MSGVDAERSPHPDALHHEDICRVSVVMLAGLVDRERGRHADSAASVRFHHDHGATKCTKSTLNVVMSASMAGASASRSEGAVGRCCAEFGVTR